MRQRLKADQETRSASCWLVGWISAAVFCVAGSSAQSAEKVLPIAGEVFSVADRTAFLILPEKLDTNHAIPWVWYAPALNGLPGKEETWMFRKFLDAGIAIAGIDVGESYGSPKGRSLYFALYKELVENRRMADRACLLARSRGGLMLYGWAAENPKSVACIAGIYPVCNLNSYPGLDRACGAYEMSKEELVAKLAEHNPIDRLASLAEAKVPIFHIHGDRDAVVPLEANSGELAQRYKTLGGTMTLKVIEGQGHNMWTGWFQDQDLVNFVIAQADAKKSPNKQQANDSVDFQFDGEWKPKGAILGGVFLPPPALAAITLTIDCGTYEVTVTGEDHSDKGTYTLDKTASPKRMTIKSHAGPNQGKTFLAIYEIKNTNAMRVCYDLSGKAFPKEFKAPKGTPLYLVGYRRQETNKTDATEDVGGPKAETPAGPAAP